jgi:hypothetical protein
MEFNYFAFQKTNIPRVDDPIPPKFRSQIFARAFWIIDLNFFTILDQALPTPFQKVNPMALLWSTYKPHFKLGLHPTPPAPFYVADIVLTET